MLVFLDDIRKDPTVVHNKNRGLGIAFGNANNWIIARNYEQFVNILKDSFDKISFISFDHDISSWDKDGKELTGKDAAMFLTDYCIDYGKKLPDWYVHSDNNNGNKNIRQWLLNYMFRVEGRLDKMEDGYGFVGGNIIYNL